MRPGAIRSRGPVGLNDPRTGAGFGVLPYGGAMPGVEDPYDEADPAEWDEDAPPAWFAGQHLPDDARRIGLTHHVPDGALLDFAGRLDSAKPLHRATAWVMLVVFGFPVLMYLWRLLLEVLPD